MAEPTVRLVNVSKSFGEVKSLQNVNLEVYPGEVVGLLGDNGAGKSTLIKIITGYHQPDPGGEIYLHGQKVDNLSVAKARQLGVETVYQEKALADDHSHLWAQVCTYSRAHSKPDKQRGRAFNLYKDITGKAPPNAWRFDVTPDVEITRPVRNKITSLNLAFSKRRGA